MRVQIIVEGGGEGGASITECRKGFEAFFSKMLEGRDRPRISPGGGRSAAFKLFRATLGKLGEGDHVILLVDSEGPIAESDDPWDYVQQRNGDEWLKPDLATADDLHFMVPDPTGLQVLKCRVSGQRPSWHPSSYQGRGCKNGCSAEDPADLS